MSNPTLRQTLNLADAALTNWQLAYRKESDYLVCNCCGVTATKPCLPECEINNAMIAVRATLAQLDATKPTQAHREAGERILRSAGDDLTHRGVAETVAGACDIENADLRAEVARLTPSAHELEEMAVIAAFFRERNFPDTKVGNAAYGLSMFVARAGGGK